MSLSLLCRRNASIMRHAQRAEDMRGDIQYVLYYKTSAIQWSRNITHVCHMLKEREDHNIRNKTRKIS
jgi:hypothetical protein